MSSGPYEQMSSHVMRAVESLFLELSVHLCTSFQLGLGPSTSIAMLQQECCAVWLKLQQLCSSLSVLTQTLLKKHHVRELSNIFKWVLALQLSCNSDTSGDGREQD